MSAKTRRIIAAIVAVALIVGLAATAIVSATSGPSAAPPPQAPPVTKPTDPLKAALWDLSGEFNNFYRAALSSSMTTAPTNAEQMKKGVGYKFSHGVDLTEFDDTKGFCLRGTQNTFMTLSGTDAYTRVFGTGKCNYKTGLVVLDQDTTAMDNRETQISTLTDAQEVANLFITYYKNNPKAPEVTDLDAKMFKIIANGQDFTEVLGDGNSLRNYTSEGFDFRYCITNDDSGVYTTFRKNAGVLSVGTDAKCSFKQTFDQEAFQQEATLMVENVTKGEDIANDIPSMGQWADEFNAALKKQMDQAAASSEGGHSEDDGHDH